MTVDRRGRRSSLADTPLIDKRPRRLKATPEALAARGAPAVRCDPTPEPLALTVDSTPVLRASDAASALALLEAATRMISEARSRLILAGAGTTNPATVAAARAVSEALKATDGTRHVLKTLTR